MAAERRGLVAYLAGFALVVALPAPAAEPIAPGVKRVCVPAEDGRTWECGTADDPPQQRPLAPRESPPPPSFLAAPDAPVVVPIEEVPAANAEPIRPRTDDFPDAPARDEGAVAAEDAAAADAEAPVEDAAVASEEPAAPEAGAGHVTEPAAEVAAEIAPESPPAPADEPPVTESTAAEALETGGEPPTEPPAFLAAPPRRGLSPGLPLDSAPVAETAAETEAPAADPAGAPGQPRIEPSLESQPEPLVEAAAEPAPKDVAAAAPQTPSEAVVESTSAPVEDVVAESESVVESAPEPAPPEPVAEIPPASPPPAADITPRGREDFLALSGALYTVQLAHARDASGFPALLATLGLDGGDAYAVPFDRDGARWWMLTWSSFPDAASARAALARLPRGEGVNVGYPRRIALIQNELRK